MNMADCTCAAAQMYRTIYVIGRFAAVSGVRNIEVRDLCAGHCTNTKILPNGPRCKCRQQSHTLFSLATFLSSSFDVGFFARQRQLAPCSQVTSA